ncbi:MAG: hypothetical protein ACJ705_08170 [Nitrososphaeraceae archaeon]
MLFRNNRTRNRAYCNGTYAQMNFGNEAWFMDLQKLSNDELMRIYNIITTDKYEFAKNAWYIPLAGDKRCPIMVAKGYHAPQSPEKMAEFEDTAKILEKDYQRFIDAWDFGYITKNTIERAILAILELRSIAIMEHTP